MNIAIKETTKKKTTRTVKKKQEIKPEWFDKQIEAKKPDLVSKKELEEMLKEFD